MVMITQRAAEQIKFSAQQSGSPAVLRIAAQRKPDRSIEYAMGFDEAVMTDSQTQFYGVNIIVSASSEPLLEGATLDYVALAPDDYQFIFLNPNDPSYMPPRQDDSAAGGEQEINAYDANSNVN